MEQNPLIVAPGNLPKGIVWGDASPHLREGR